MNCPCSVCNKNAITDVIECDICESWVHRSCAKLSKTKFKQLADSTDYYYCPICINVFPFSSLNDDDFVYVNSHIDVRQEVFNVYQTCNSMNSEVWIDEIDPDVNFYKPQFNCKYVTETNLKVYKEKVSGLSIIHFNARSLSKNFQNIMAYIESLDTTFHIIAISETWLNANSDLGLYKIQNYEMLTTSRLDERGGGVCLYIHNLLNYKKLVSESIFMNKIYECVTAEIIIPHGSNIVVSCIYRPPEDNLEQFIECFETLLSRIRLRKSVYLVGDFNINLLKHETHRGTRDFIDLLYSLGFFPTITVPTRVTQTSSTLIDNIFTNVVGNSCQSGVLCADLTDHLPIFCVTENRGLTNVFRKEYKVVRKITEAKIECFKERLLEVDWSHVHQQNDVNEAFNYFLEIFIRLYNETFPQKRILQNLKNDTKPWMTKSIINACAKKNMLYRQFLRNRCPQSENKYKRYKNRLTSILRVSEKMHYSKLLEQNVNNSKGTWKILNNVLKPNQGPTCTPNEFVSEDKNIVKGKTNIANGFNNFFVNVGSNLAKNIPCHQEKSFYDFLGNKNTSSMFIEPVVQKEILNLTSQCKGKNSKDCNDISMKVIKNVMSSVIEPFTHICNLSFSTGVFPDAMKTAKVIPLHKSGAKNCFNNYRPVSLLPQFSKILEKLFDNRLQKFFDKHDIICKSQYGFRPNFSTSHALMELIEEITMAKDNNLKTIGVFIDLKKAFDTLNHNILLNKLEFYGIRGIANSWLKSYLSNRKQFVQLGEHRSQMRTILNGVPQGSILGPKLFIAYINDIQNVSNILKFILFADDTNAFSSSRNLRTLCKQVNTELNKLQVWFDVNKLSLNTEKTNYIVFTKNNCKEKDLLKLEINGIQINRVENTKFLGTIIDEKLNWKMHISVVKNKLAKILSIMYKAKKVLNEQSIFTIYNSLFLPHLFYCSEIWVNTYKSNIEPINVLQRKAIRIIFGLSKYDSTKPYFSRLKTLTFPDIIKYKTATVMYQAYHKKLPSNLQKCFVLRVETSTHKTRQIDNFITQYRRTCKRASCVSIVGQQLWNRLPKTVSQSKSIIAFKRNYKSLLLTS